MGTWIEAWVEIKNEEAPVSPGPWLIYENEDRNPALIGYLSPDSYEAVKHLPDFNWYGRWMEWRRADNQMNNQSNKYLDGKLKKMWKSLMRFIRKMRNANNTR